MINTGCTAKADDYLSLKMGEIPLTINLPAHVAEQEGFFKEQKLKIEFATVNSTVEQNTILLTENVDGIFQHIFQTVVLNSNSDTCKIIGSSEMPDVYYIIASPRSGINSPQDLRGKEISVATSTVIDYALEQLLLTEGLTSADIIKNNTPSMPLRLEMLNQGKVPAAILSSPLAELAVLNGGKVIINDKNRPLGGPGLLFTRNSLDTKSEAISRFVIAWQKAVDLINENPQKYRDLLMEIANASPDVDLKVPLFPRLEVPAEEEVLSVVNWMTGEGLLTRALTYNDLVDTKYLR